MQKRIAIQLFGHLRTYEKLAPYFIENVVKANEKDGYKVDIFIHTWDELDHNTITYRNLGSNFMQEKISENEIQKIYKLYNPKKLLIEKQKDCKEKTINQKMGTKQSIKGCFNMAHSLYQGSNLRREYAKENNIKYDWVIVTRADILFKNPYRIDDFLNIYSLYGFEINKNSLFYSLHQFARGKIKERRFLGASDLIYFANEENVNKATSLCENFYKNIDFDDFYCMEIWWYDFWCSMGLLPLEVQYSEEDDFEVVQNEEKLKKFFPMDYKNSKYKKYILKKKIFSVFPYFLVKEKIEKLNKKLLNCV